MVTTTFGRATDKAAPIVSGLASADSRYLWLALGTLSWFFAVGGRWDLPFAPWLFAVFLLRFSRTSRPISAVLLIALASIAAAFFWAFELAVPMNGMIAAGVIAYGLVFAAPFTLDRLITPRLGPIAALFLFPAVHTACEFLLGSFSPQGASYGVLAVTQTDDLPLQQLVSVTGPYGVGFLICAFATVANWVWEHPRSWAQARWIVGAYAAVLVSVILAGGARLAFFPPAPDYVRVAGISPSTAVIAKAQAKLGRPVTAQGDARSGDPLKDQAGLDPITTELFDNTHRAAQAGARVVVWSENASALAPGGRAALLARAADVARTDKIYLEVADNLPANFDETNLFGPTGALLWTYHKAHPIPGLEPYVPGDGRVPSVRTPFGQMANVICYDADFPKIMRSGADIMLVPGGDWPEMGRVHTLKMASLRAIENGYALFRQDFNGLSAGFDSQGRVLGMQDTTTADQHLFMVDLPTRGVVTPYRTIGDVFAWLSAMTAIALVGVGLLRPRRVRG